MTTKAQIGKGLYTTNEISLLLGLSKEKVNRWLAEYWQGYFWEKDKSKAIDFVGLIEFYVFFQLRERNISTNKIKEAHSSLQSLYKTKYPFATSKLMTYDTKIKFNYENGIVDAERSLQYNIIEVIEPFAEKIEYNSDDIAQRFYPAGKEIDIVADPEHKFGFPVIKTTNIEIDVIYYYYKSGEKAKRIAELFDIKENQVNDVVRFYNKSL